MGIVNIPEVLGAGLVAADSAGISAMSTDGMTQGTQVFNVTTGSYFQLVASTATLSASVLSVLGTTGARWIAIGGSSGFVTLSALADTTVTSGATLVGVNSNLGMFSQPDLQHVLQEDVVLKAVIAATTGTGAATVGIQDTGNYYTGTTVEAAEQEIGASLALKAVSSVLASTSVNVGASLVGINDAGGIITATQVEAALQEIMVKANLKLNIANPTFTGVMQATTGGTAAAPPYGFAGAGGQYGMYFNGSNQVGFARAGVAIGFMDFNVMTVSDNGSVDVELRLGSDTSFKRSLANSWGELANTNGIKVISKFGLAATPVAPQSVLASLTNNCTASGTTGTIPNFTSLTVYATDAQAIHDGISQLAKKLTVMETAIKSFGLLIT